jgi:hypothetical protein
MDYNLANKIGVTICYSELFRRHPTLEDLHNIIRPLKRQDVLISISWLLAVTKVWQTIQTNETERKVWVHFLPTHHARLPRAEDRFAFSRYTLLWLAKQACIVCPSEGMLVDTPETRERLGLACLMVNDLITPRSRFNGPLDLAASMIASTDYYSHDEQDRDLVRTRYFLRELAPQSKQPAVRDFPARIESLLGFDIDEYCDLALSTCARNMSANVDDLRSYTTPGVTAENFKTTAVDPHRVTEFLRTISAAEETLHDEFSSRIRSLDDLTTFRIWPILKTKDDLYALLDVALVLDKAGRSLVWTALNASNNGSERKQMLGIWGCLLDEYVSALLKETSHPTRTVIANPCFEDGTEALDCCVIEGGSLVAIEVKSSTLTNEVRYADDASRLQEELEKKFVTGDGDGLKGLSQLARFVSRFSQGHPVLDPSTKKVVAKKSSVRVVFPLLVFLDTALRTPGVNRYLQSRFKDLYRTSRTITPLLTMPVAELEEVQGHLDEVLLNALLESFSSTNRDHMMTFVAAHVPIVKERGRKMGPMVGRLDDLLNQLRERLFPGTPMWE